MGKIRSTLEDVFLDCEGDGFYDMAWYPSYASDYRIGIDYSYAWSLQEYKKIAKEGEQEWDELEKSIITSVADDVIVGVKGRTASLIIVKKFA